MEEKTNQFCATTDELPAMIWASGPDGLRIYFNRRWLDFTGRPIQLELHGRWTEGVHPDDLTRCLGLYSRILDLRQEFRVEYRLRRFDGQYRWVLETGAPCLDTDGSLTGYSAVCFDITESKADAEALSRATRRLIEALDQERIRIAGELHEDIGSSLSILGIELMRAGQPVEGSSGVKYPDMQEIYQKLQEIGSKVSRLSNQLQPSILKYFGLAKAAESECREFSKMHQVPVSCSCNSIPARLDPDVALNFYRVLQEALSNAARHGHAIGIAVDLTGTSDELHLVVSDDGIGFDAGHECFPGGLGLISMRERMRRVGGQLEISSRPGRGAKISCRAPLAPSI